MPRAARTGDVVDVMTAMLESDPTLVGKQFTERLNLSGGRLVRLFKARTGMSIVEFRNQLRFKRFLELRAVETNRRLALHKTVRSAGFGSYAHFHRLFRARWESAPSAAMYQSEATR